MRVRGLVLPLLLLLTGPWAWADAPWRVSGETTFRMDRYSISGAKNQSPYDYAGSFAYQSFNITALSGEGEGDRSRFDVAGVVNGSPYRSDFQGAVPERLHYMHSHSGVDGSYRMDFGDQYVDFGPLTLQRAVKGARFEVEPEFRHSDEKLGLVLFSGSDRPRWRSGGPSGTYYNGASVRLADRWLGKYKVNLVHDNRPACGNGDGGNRWVGSVTGRRRFAVIGQKLDADGELAGVASTDSAAGDDGDGTGVLARISGSDTHRPLTYRFHFHRYGRGFRSDGSVVDPNTRAMGLEAQWRFSPDRTFTGRFDRSTDQFQGADPIRTDTVGLGFKTPIGGNGMSSSFSEVAQASRSPSLATDWRSWLSDVQFIIPHAPGGELDVGVRLFRLLDDANHSNTHYLQQLSVNHSSQVAIGYARLSLSPGVVFRQDVGDVRRKSANPTLSVSLDAGRQHFSGSVDYGHLISNNVVSSEVESYRVGINYRFETRQFTWGLGYEHILRQPTGAASTQAWHALAFVTYRFDRGGAL